ncbi:hypothetical protein [Streptomyces adelaidensis]|uniref:hypothetical protein n=1 Tax=Streptomyces adelaidensis TaxID=2796465 RepID=UPI001903716F|nr:hypothetical protein [Streptomyces adelaidensis]
MTADASLPAPVIVAAALLIRTALGELRQPGGARERWAWTTDRPAMAGGAVAAMAVLLLGRH